MRTLPQPLQIVVDRFSSLPGVGPKSALRMAMALLAWPVEDVRDFGKAVAALRDDLKVCSTCAALTATDPCAICADPARNRDQLCVVAEWDSLLVMEEAGLFKGRYLVLGGLLAPLDGTASDKLRFELLHERLESREIREVILALGSTLEAEATGSHLKNMIERSFPAVRVSRLAQGIPLGAEIKYMDRETLKQSMQFRQDI